LGYKNIKNSIDCEIYGNYFNTRSFKVVLNEQLTVTNYHRPL